MKILVTDDAKTSLAIITATLQEFGHEVLPAKSGNEAIQVFKDNRPDLIILDVVMGDMTGYDCARKIRSMDTDDWIPIIFLSASIDEKSIAKGIDAGGDDYLTKPFSEITLAAKIKAMERITKMRRKLFNLTKELHTLSTTDRLTGLYNRLEFDRRIKEKIADANRFNMNIGLLFIDLDKFKSVNDNLGHPIGDLLLQKVAERLLACQRANDFVARLGGDEFAVIILGINDPKDAGFIAEHIIHSLSQEFILQNHRVSIGASIGIAIYPLMAKNEEELIRNADTAMYRVKQKRRNNFEYFMDLNKDIQG